MKHLARAVSVTIHNTTQPSNDEEEEERARKRENRRPNSTATIRDGYTFTYVHFYKLSNFNFTVSLHER